MGESTTESNRRRRFKAALKRRGLTAKAWATSQSITRGHLHQVLTGQRDSQKLLDAVDQFIADAEGATGAAVPEKAAA